MFVVNHMESTPTDDRLLRKKNCKLSSNAATFLYTPNRNCNRISSVADLK